MSASRLFGPLAIHWRFIGDLLAIYWRSVGDDFLYLKLNDRIGGFTIISIKTIRDARFKLSARWNT